AGLLGIFLTGGVVGRTTGRGRGCTLLICSRVAWRLITRCSVRVTLTALRVTLLGIRGVTGGRRVIVGVGAGRDFWILPVVELDDRGGGALRN
ncbi:MAG: hypothetical protein ACK2T5_09375, partial [Anaerolineales bacterium]